MKRLLTFLVLLISLNSCQNVTNPIKDFFNGIVNKQSEKREKKKEEDNNKPVVIKTYYEKSGALKSEITVQNKRKNGPAKKYYPSGELHTLVNYVNNVKVGETIWYYKNGQPYRVTPYENGKMHGIRKKYYENGKIQAEIPYKNGKLMVGTKEYDKDGSVISNPDHIVFEPINNIRLEGKFILKMKLPDKQSKTKFFEEKTSTEGNKVKVPVQTNESGTGKIEYVLPRGASKKAVLKIYAQYETRLRNPVLISDTYHLDIENR